jgi:hypothetical protein
MVNTRIHAVIDRSGSMNACLDDTIGGWNAFVDSSDPNALISLHLFDHEFQTVYENKKKSEIPPLTHLMYRPRGSTALLDAIGQTIKLAEPKKWSDDEDKVIIVILTDGQENASQNFKHKYIKTLIEEKKSEGWTFVYLAANQDAIATGEGYGIGPETSLTFSPMNVDVALRSASKAIQRGNGFTPEERTDSLL